MSTPIGRFRILGTVTSRDRLHRFRISVAQSEAGYWVGIGTLIGSEFVTADVAHELARMLERAAEKADQENRWDGR